MKIKFFKYNFDDGRRVVMLIEALGYIATVIGSLKRRGYSNNDIDIYLPQTAYDANVAANIMKAFSTNQYEITDWGSLYLSNTLFGTLDIFFKGQTDEFDY